MTDVTSAVRPVTRDDVEAVLALARADELRVTGRASRLTAADVGDWWERVDLAADSWLVTAPSSSSVVGAAWVERSGGDLGVCFPMGDAWPFLLERAEQLGRATGIRRLHVAALTPDPPVEALLGARGYVEVRRFWEMAIQLDGPPAPVTLPPGLSLSGVTADDARAFHDTIVESFQDHWESHPRPFDEWWASRTSDPDLDLSWWFTVRDGDRTVAAIRNVPARNGGVYVATLGVRRPYRGQGLGKALLRHTFARSWEAGFPRVTLGVDAASATGATALYRGAGMVTELETVVWERLLDQAG